MPFCVYCGAKLPDGVRFCVACGQPAYVPPKAPQEVPQPSPQPAYQPMPQPSYQPASQPMPQPSYQPAFQAESPDPENEKVLYDGVCLKRENGIQTTPGDCIITPRGLYYYSRSKFVKQTGRKGYDFLIESRNVAEIRTSTKNMNKVMELCMRDGSVQEFYSPKFDKMLKAMQTSVGMK